MEAPATVSTPEYEPPVIRQRRVRKNPREAVTLDAHRQHCDCSSESQCLATCGPPCVVEISRSPLAEYADCEPPQPESFNCLPSSPKFEFRRSLKAQAQWWASPGGASCPGGAMRDDSPLAENRSPGVRRSLSHEIWEPGMRCERPLAHVIPLTHASLKEHEKMWAR